MIWHKADLAVVNRPDIFYHINTLVLQLTIAGKKIFYVLVYRRFGQTVDEFNNFVEKFDEALTKIEAENPYCIAAGGDYNAHLKEWYKEGRSDSNGVHIQKVFLDHGMVQLVDQPTYIVNTTKTCVDLFATDQPNLVLTNEVLPSPIPECHHQINYVKLSLKCPPPPPFERRVWHHDRADVKSIQKAIHDFNWEEELGNLDDSPEEQVNLFDNVIMNIMLNLIPYVDKICRPKEPPWITKGSKNLYNSYRRKYKKIAKKGYPLEEKPQMDALKIEYTNLIKTEKNKYMSSLGQAVSNPRSGPKKYWAAMKKLLKKNITSVIPPILHNGLFILNSSEKGSLFNQYFKDQCKTIVTSSTLPPWPRQQTSHLRKLRSTSRAYLSI